MNYLWVFLIFIPLIRTAPSTSTPPIRICSLYDEESYRIFNGRDADLLDHPWYALLKITVNGEEIRCGGSLIGEEYVLTAAHCFSSLPNFANSNEFFDPLEVQIILGEHNTNTNPDIDSYDENLQTTFAIFKVAHIAIPMTFDRKRDREDYSYDVALIKLKGNAPRRENIEPICLPNDEVLGINLEGKRLTAAGFGRTESVQLSDKKKLTDMTVISEKVCENMYISKPMKNGKILKINGENQLCATDLKADTCNGDSGGPFVFKNRFLMGIVSAGANECGDKNYPAVFTKINTEIIEWIQEVIESYDQQNEV